MKKMLCLFLVVMMVALLGTGCGGQESTPAEQDSTVKVGFVYVGPVGDGGWTDAHNEGKLYMEEQLQVETVIKENVPEGPECEKVINDMIDQGCNIIFATSFGFMDYAEKAANNHPDVKILHCSGYKSSENMNNYFGRMYESRYLSGIVAGMRTEANKIGYVAAYEIPEVIRGLNAFTLGVRSVNPEAVVKVKWTHTWYDPAKEKEAAKALLAEGVDVIAQHQDTTGPQQAAEESGVWSIGYNTDMSESAPTAYMTSPIWHWGPYYVSQVKAVMDGTWKSEAFLGNLKDGTVDLVPLTENAPEGAQEAVEKAKAEILSGENKIFTGPLKDNTGELRVKEGITMTDEELFGTEFMWLVEGVEGKVE